MDEIIEASESILAAIDLLRARDLQLASEDRTYRIARASALLASEEKSADRRDADADLASSQERHARDVARAEERAARYLVEALLAGRIQP